MTLQAIETKYNGYKFRSRLEAYWAVFFDAARINYQYEIEGFDIDGIWYLPDFYLPLLDAYVEIKPTLSHAVLGDVIDKIRALSSNNKTSFLIAGEPRRRKHTVFVFKNADCVLVGCLGVYWPKEDRADAKICIFDSAKLPYIHNWFELAEYKGSEAEYILENAYNAVIDKRF